MREDDVGAVPGREAELMRPHIAEPGRNLPGQAPRAALSSLARRAGELVLHVAGLLLARRREIGTPRGSQALSCREQAVFTLAWFRDRPDVARLGQGFGISQATAYRYPGGDRRAGSPGARAAAGAGAGEGAEAAVLDPGRRGRRCRPAEREDHQQEGPRDRPVVPRKAHGSGGISRPCSPPVASRYGPLRSCRAAPMTSPPRAHALTGSPARHAQPWPDRRHRPSRPRPRPTRAQDDHVKVAEKPQWS